MPFKGSRIIPEQSKQIKMGRDEFKSSRHTGNEGGGGRGCWGSVADGDGRQLEDATVNEASARELIDK
jgi:hypothetical protein